MPHSPSKGKKWIIAVLIVVCAIVLAGDILKRLRAGELRRVLLAATGALMSPVSAMQGESIPAVCHAVTIEGEGIA